LLLLIEDLSGMSAQRPANGRRMLRSNRHCWRCATIRR